LEESTEIIALAALFAWWLWLDYRRDRDDGYTDVHLGCCKDDDEPPAG